MTTAQPQTATPLRPAIGDRERRARVAMTEGEITMSLERYLRIIAGSFILISLALAHWVSPYWLWVTVFVGANLLQSGFTKWCLMEDILRKTGVGSSCCGAGKPAAK